MKVLIVYYSMYGHIYKMAQGVAEGVRLVEGAEAVLRRVPDELAGARFQGQHVARIAKKLAA